MTREEALQVLKERMDYYEREKRMRAAIEVLVPELAEYDGSIDKERLINDFEEAMQKEQKPINQCNTHEPTLDEARKWNEAYEKGYSLGYENGRNEQKSTDNVSKDEYVKKFKALCDAYEIKLPNRAYDIYHLCDDLAELFGNTNKQEKNDLK